MLINYALTALGLVKSISIITKRGRITKRNIYELEVRCLGTNSLQGDVSFDLYLYYICMQVYSYDRRFHIVPLII